MITAQETWQPAHEHQSDVWSYISPSRLGLWLRCPLAFSFRYKEDIKSPTTPSLFIGKQCHSSLEVFYRHRQLGIALDAEEVAKRMIDGWEKAVAEEDMQFKTEADEMKAKLQTVDLVAAYMEHIPEDEPRPLAVEATMEAPLIDPFTGEDFGIPLLGIVDLVLDEPQGPLIADFKTTARGGTPAEITHEIQLTSYSYLFRQLDGRKEAGLEIRSLIKTKTPRIEFHHYDARSKTHFKRLFGVIREYLDALDSGRFNFRPGWGCSMCDFRQTHCQRWCG
jgi:putative RecB family exonuclease